MKYAVNIEVIYRELPFAERFAAAKRDGFDYVEIWDWESKDLEELKDLCKRYGLEIGVDIRCQREEIFDMMHRI